MAASGVTPRDRDPAIRSRRGDLAIAEQVGGLAAAERAHGLGRVDEATTTRPLVREFVIISSQRPQLQWAITGECKTEGRLAETPSTSLVLVRGGNAVRCAAKSAEVIEHGAAREAQHLCDIGCGAAPAEGAVGLKGRNQLALLGA